MTDLTPLNAGVILLLAGRRAGERRDLSGIIGACELHGADKDVVCGAFGFFRCRRDSPTYRDFFRDSEFDPIINGPEVATAFNLAIDALLDNADARQAMASRIMNKIRRNRAAVKRRT